ncbi:LD-carboxypeptidase [Aeromonas caviae]|uniref:LD-carboxypeptidase n=1 Tax=Aeromonas caviae TaxID=648 RepID=A0ABD0B468_AERCA|nr:MULTISPECIES: S66 peptidase family protein [Aeromonas]MBL0645938.1 LD-carboxypeptidase [Aeromonas caviae]MEB5773149.1 LD-carboxypeptidase [Aeromonas caviae]MEB6648306.1 LD-carboxypeptidase [Aeromonas caviae]BCR29554.1 LD-carboxypeptidase [Aeromonas caviae]GJA80385.1 LD-carboxypeptidase [Aeromonas caviae]
MTLLKPPGLNPGDTIGFFSPSSAATAWAPNRFARAKAYLAAQGFELKAGSLTGEQDHWRSGSIAARADELNALIRDPQVRAIMSVIGGSNSNSLLPYLDFDALKRDPKIVIGYSDVTALLLGIHAQTGLVTFYGPALVASFGELSPLVDETLVGFLSVCMAGGASLPHRLPTPTQWTEERLDWEHQTRAKQCWPNRLISVGTGRVRGRLIGGNLNTLAGIWGSPYMPSIKRGDILLLEDSLKTAETVERSFAHLKLCGVFERIGALVLGKHELFDSQGSCRRPLDILLEVVGEPTFPILAEYDCAHTHPMLTLPLGIEAELDLDAQSLTLCESWLGE